MPVYSQIQLNNAPYVLKYIVTNVRMCVGVLEFPLRVQLLSMAMYLHAPIKAFHNFFATVL